MKVDPFWKELWSISCPSQSHQNVMKWSCQLPEKVTCQCLNPWSVQRCALHWVSATHTNRVLNLWRHRSLSEDVTSSHWVGPTQYKINESRKKKIQISRYPEHVTELSWIFLVSETKTNIIDEWFSKCGPWDHSISLTWECVRNAEKYVGFGFVFVLRSICS